MIPPVEDLRARLRHAAYIADEALASVLWMALKLERPLLVEGEAGVGKTALAAAAARALERPLLRLQCYEGLDLAQAVYEWNYSRQLLEIRLAEAGAADRAHLRENLFSEAFLLQRPLLQAIRSPTPTVLLIDEIDRADEAFEAFLLEMLAEHQVSIPELGTLTALSRPLVVLTSNATRELSDALRRRCLYQFLDYPDLAREMAIVQALVPEAAERLVAEAVAFVQRLRREDLEKTPGVAETLDWVRSLFHLGLGALPSDPAALAGTLSALLKTRADAFQVGADVVRRLAAGRSPAEDAALAAGRPPGEDPALAAEAADGAAGAGAR
jgi:MoxR-like ATPase